MRIYPSKKVTARYRKAVDTVTNETISDNVEDISRSQNYTQTVMENTNE